MFAPGTEKGQSQSPNTTQARIHEKLSLYGLRSASGERTIDKV